MEMKQKPGFSLIEILVVMAVIGILAAITFGMFKSSRESTRRRIAEADIALFKLKLNDFRLEEGFMPTSTNIPILRVAGADQYDPNPGSDGYFAAGRRLFLALSGRSTLDLVDGRDRTGDGKAYIRFERLRIGDPEVPGAALPPQYRETYLDEAFDRGSWVKDPWGNPYGFYFHERASLQSLHGKTVADIWSTAGESAESDIARARWISSWKK